MPVNKRYLHLPDACEHPDIPWNTNELRRRIHAARPRYNSRNEIIQGTGNNLLLKAVIQEKPGGPIWIDMQAIHEYIEASRQGGTEAA